jgi:hypothetical protein
LDLRHFSEGIEGKAAYEGGRSEIWREGQIRGWREVKAFSREFSFLLLPPNLLIFDEKAAL